MTRIKEALDILTQLGLPRAQQNERSALCLLALLNLTPDKEWQDAESRLIGITPMMDFAREQYGKEYAPNTRETFRRQTMHQFMDAGLALYNPDKPNRPVNSPKAVYQIEPLALELIQCYGREDWDRNLFEYLAQKGTLAEQYAQRREQRKIPVVFEEGKEFYLSPGEHSRLIKDIIEEFAPRFVPRSRLLYAGDTGAKNEFIDEEKLAELGIVVDKHGKMPDVVLYYPTKNWIILAEAVTSHGPVDPKRYAELKELFAGSTAGLIYLTAFPTKSLMAKYLSEISWETEVWIAEAPSHLIHFDGERFLGPYE